MSNPEASISTTRNSTLRKFTAEPISKLTEKMYEVAPWLSPTHINILGAIGTIAGAYMAAKDGELTAGKKAEIAAILGTSIGLDGIDGQYAREKAKFEPGKVDFNKGQIYDILVDRTEEVTLCISRAIKARKDGSNIGSDIALINAITTAFPSIARANAEANGVAVPEIGKSPLKAVGSRPGRTSLGIAATLFPEIKRFPAQILEDAVMTTGNIMNALDRHKIYKKSDEANLQEEVKAQALERRRALLIFEAIAIGAAVATYTGLRKMDNKRRPIQTQETIAALGGISLAGIDYLYSKFRDSSKIQISSTEQEAKPENERYLGTLLAIEQYCQEHQLDHRFVGGTLTDLIGPQTTFNVDAENRSVSFENPNEISMLRKDGSVKDIDLIILSNDQEAFKKTLKEFGEWQRLARESNLPFPNISVEAAYHPDWQKRNKIKQFVSAFEVDGNGQLNLAFGEVKQQIPWESMEPWKAGLGDGKTITILHPFAHALCYQLRVPSGVKKKDCEQHKCPDGQTYSKISLLGDFAEQAIEAQGNGVDHRTYRSWIEYIDKLRRLPDKLTAVKAHVVDTYWKTIGTDVSHGTGPLGKLSTLSSRMNGS